MTPTLVHLPDPPVPRENGFDISRLKLTLRDMLVIVVTIGGMWGVQTATQWSMRSDIRDLKTLFESYERLQSDTNSTLQRQVDEWRAETKLNRVNLETTQRELAELKGLLVGSGLKGLAGDGR